MSSIQREQGAEFPAGEKSAWSRPEYARLEIGDAEAQDGEGTETNSFLS